MKKKTNNRGATTKVYRKWEKRDNLIENLNETIELYSANNEETGLGKFDTHMAY